MNRVILVRLATALIVAATVAGCGYRLANRASNLPGDVRTLYVELFQNRSYEPYLENRLTEEVVAEFALHQTLKPVARAEEADALLAGVIQSYVTEPISYFGDDDIAEYRSRLVLLVTLKRQDTGQVLWKGELSWSEEYPASDDKITQEDNEAVAIGMIAERIAEELHFRVVENF